MLLLAALLAAVQAGPAPAQSGARCRGQAATIVGTDGPDRIKGTPGKDVIVAYGGNDRIKGLGGNDIICAGSGRNRVNSGAGNDYVAADNGNDRVSAGAGRDVVEAGGGDDYIAGGGGNDVLKGGAGDDQLAGGRGRDRLDGGSGFDSCGPASVLGREPGGVFGPARPARACEVEAISVRRQTVTFAGQEWSILSAVGSYESRFTFGNPSREPDMTDERRLFVELRAINRTSESFVGSRHQVLLALPGEPVVRTDANLSSSDAGSTLEGVVSFPVPERADLSDAVIVLGSTDVEQELLPLTGAKPSSRFPLRAQIDTTVRNVVTFAVKDAAVEMLSAEWDLELGDHDPRGGSFGETAYRAPAGHRVLRVTARYTSLESRLSSNILGQEIRASIDGIPRSEVTTTSEILGPGAALDVVFAFHVPEGASSVVILVGTPGGPAVAEFPVVVPDLSR